MKGAKGFMDFMKKGAGGEGGGGPKPPAFLAPLITAVGGLSILGYGAYNSVVVVQPGHLGLVYNRTGGLNEGTLNEGLNFVIPWSQRPVVYDCRIRSQVLNTPSGTKDLQLVAISLRVVFKPNPSEIATIYRTLGKDYDARVLPSIVNEITKSVAAQYNASELLTKRDEVNRLIKSMLVARAKDFHILVEEVSIHHLEFSEEYTAAVEAYMAQKRVKHSQAISE
jgi:prohibitin 2